ncbi:hypothetical protein KM043_013757 [Ampulex compressa]|nr:hypothetical protein KM043_013757 [Ampulex compressa]
MTHSQLIQTHRAPSSSEIQEKNGELGPVEGSPWRILVSEGRADPISGLLGRCGGQAGGQTDGGMEEERFDGRERDV